MRSTWMDPLIKAQHAKRRTHAATGAAIWATQRQGEPPQAEPLPDDEKLAAPRRGRSQRLMDSLDLEAAADWEAEPADILPEIEREIGISDWIDPETGEPAEGQSPPHLEIE